MKIAIPTDNNMVSAHFGHCAQFTIYEIDEGQKKVESKKVIDNPAMNPDFYPDILQNSALTA